VAQRKRLNKIWRWGLLLLVGFVTVAVIALFAVAPSLIAKRMNPVGQTILPPIEALSQKIHQSLTIADLHADSLLWERNLLQQSNDGHVDIPRLIQGSVALQMFTVVTKVPTNMRLEGNSDRTDNITRLAIVQRWPMSTWFSLKQRALYQAQKLQTLERSGAGQFKIIQTQQDLQNYLNQRHRNPKITAGLLGLEGAQALEGNVDNVNQLYDAGFRMIGLAHFFDTEVSGSAHGVNRGGLTPLGRSVIQRMESLNMMIDLAHASIQTMDKVLEITKRPVLVSHTGVQGTCDNPRNLSDRHLQKIAKTGGVIGIGFWETAVCGKDVDAIVRAIRYVVDRVGVDYVALGSDFDGAVRVPFDVANLDQITMALQKAGLTEADIRKIMGLNVIRLLQQLLPTN
jgi:membrane dipeptidase